MRLTFVTAIILLLPASLAAQEATLGEGHQVEEVDTVSEAETEEPGQTTIVLNGDAKLVVNGDVQVIGAGPAIAAGGEGEAGAEAKKPERDEIDRPIEILEVLSGEVRLDVGSRDGVKAGELFAVYRRGFVKTQAEGAFEGEQLVAVLEVFAVSEDRSMASLWKGDRVQVGDEVRRALPEHARSQVFPRHLTNIGEVSMVVRPLIAVGSTGGGGGLADVTAAYWWKHFFLDLRMQPLGFGWTEDGDIVSASFMGEIGFDSRAFAVGLGAGVSAVNGDMDEMMRSFVGEAKADGGAGVSQTNWDQRTRAAFTLSQQVRLGARDGLNVSVYNLIMYNEDGDDSGFIYAGTAGKVMIPLAARTFLFLEGGGGVMGYGFGDLGVFTWVRGNGDAGSIGICALAGGAGVWGARKKTTTLSTGETFTDTEIVSIAGPMVGIGMTYRFGF